MCMDVCVCVCVCVSVYATGKVLATPLTSAAALRCSISGETVCVLCVCVCVVFNFWRDGVCGCNISKLLLFFPRCCSVSGETVCVCVSVYNCVYVCTCLFLKRRRVCIYLCVCVNVCVRVCVCVCVSLSVRVRGCVRVCVVVWVL